MLTGRPPFQSPTQEEIYRKARERDYDWPSLEKTDNYICEEAKDLVALLLQSPEYRPDCDTIVQHPFFSCGWFPQQEEMSPKLRESPPDPNQFATLGLRGGRANLYTKNLKALCVQCDVGPWSKTQKAHMSTYREVAAEEKAGLTPAVPLPDDVVYRPFDEVLREYKAALARQESSAATRTQEDEPKPLNHRPVPASASTRAVPQSFAAQQRVQNRPIGTSGTVRKTKLQTEPEVGSRTANAYGATAGKGTGRSEIKPVSRNASSRSQEEAKEVPEPNASVEARIGLDLVGQLGQAKSEHRKPLAHTPSPSKTLTSLFSPFENVEILPRSKPRHVLRNLQLLHAELERALNSRSVGPLRDAPSGDPTIVVKWVDYTNKFGLGYILNDGSVGCIFKSLPVLNDPQDAWIPPTCVVVRDAETHLQNRGNDNYPDRHQLVPISGADIEFYQNNGNEGISCVKVNPQSFTTSEENGMAGRLTRGKDEWDDRKRQKIVLWKKFANYMTVFGRDQDYPYDDAVNRMSLDDESDSSEEKKTNMVIFYQRFGDVGIWGFRNGSFQVSRQNSSDGFLLTIA
jgi:serine/threonine protein kinase